MRPIAQPKFGTFQHEMTAHLDEEEAVIVPAMRRNFTEQDERKVGYVHDVVSNSVDRILCGTDTVHHVYTCRRAVLDVVEVTRFHVCSDVKESVDHVCNTCNLRVVWSWPTGLSSITGEMAALIGKTPHGHRSQCWHPAQTCVTWCQYHLERLAI